MALIKLGPLVADIRGSVGGTVFARNRGGAYARARVAPLNPQSTRQTQVRSFLASIAQRWTAILDDAERAAWETYAANVPLTNALGESRNVTGQNMYVRTNSLILDTGGVVLDAAPIEFTVGPTITPTFALSPATDLIDLSDLGGYLPDTDGPVNVLVTMGRPQNPGVNYYTSPFTKVLGQAIVTDTDLPLSPAPAPYPFDIGQAIFLRTANVTADGRVGVPVTQRFLAV